MTWGTSDGMLALAVTVLLVVVGYRVARPARAPDWFAVAGYVSALGVLHLGAMSSGPEPRAPLPLRIVGGALLVGGLIVAGSGVRAARAAGAPLLAGAPRRPAVFVGLGLVLCGQLMRVPSAPGAVAVGLAMLAIAWATAAAWRRAGAARGPEA